MKIGNYDELKDSSKLMSLCNITGLIFRITNSSLEVMPTSYIKKDDFIISIAKSIVQFANKKHLGT